MKMLIVFKSGAKVEVDVESFETAKNAASGELSRLAWVTPDGATSKLHTINLGEIAAIVALREAGEVNSDG